MSIRAQNGFTLIEMALVLMIIALVAGGVVAGQKMIRNAEVRSLIGESEQYIQALKNFRSKYRSMPGDMINATSFWEAATGCPTSGLSVKETCNGDGNGRIITQGEEIDQYNTRYEQFTAWQHLSLAGFIDGAYTGKTGSGSSEHAIPGENIPASQLSGGGWRIESITYAELIGVDGQCHTIFPYRVGDIPLNHVLHFGGGSTTCFARALLLAEEALSIDEKIDDGIPTVGRVVNYETGASCYIGDAYYMLNSKPACVLVIKTGL